MGRVDGRKRSFANRRSLSRMKAILQFALREMRQTPRRLRPGYHALGLIAAIAVLAFLGPFDTWGRLSFTDRVGFWTLAIGVNWIFGMIVGFAAGIAVERRGWAAWAGIVAAGSAAASAPGTGVVWLLVAVWMDHRMTGAAELATLYFQVLAIHLMLNLLVACFVVVRRRRAGTDEGEGRRGAERPESADGPDAARPPGEPLGAPSGAPPGAPFLDRLPARLGRRLLHLHMQDHYVEAHTEEGSDLLLLRFRDALREVEGIDGAQVHRSHWVARAAVAGVERRNGRIALRLVNGSRVPVSRSFAPALRDRGWL